MKKLLSIFFIVILLNACNETKDLSVKETYLKGKARYEKDGKTKVSGRIVFDDKGFVEQESHYKNGLKEGEETRYYKSGSIKATSNYKEGLLVGRLVQYYESGQVELEANHENGKKEGELLSYYEDGNVKVRANYRNGMREGSYIGYYKNGTIKMKTSYRKNKKNGIAIGYYEDGTLCFQSYFRNDELHGKNVEYTPEVQVRVKEDYTRGRLMSKEPLYVKSSVLLNDFLNKKSLAKRKYKDKTAVIKGKVTQVNNRKGMPVIMLDGLGGWSGGIQCYFVRYEQLQGINVGDEISIKGHIQGSYGRRVVVETCYVYDSNKNI